MIVFKPGTKLVFEGIMTECEKFSSEEDRYNYLISYLERMKIERKKESFSSSISSSYHDPRETKKTFADDPYKLDIIENKIQNEIEFKKEVFNAKNNKIWAYVNAFQIEIKKSINDFKVPPLEGDSSEELINKILEINDIEEKYFKLLLYQKEIKNIYYYVKDSIRDRGLPEKEYLFCSGIERNQEIVSEELKLLKSKYYSANINIVVKPEEVKEILKDGDVIISEPRIIKKDTEKLRWKKKTPEDLFYIFEFAVLKGYLGEDFTKNKKELLNSWFILRYSTSILENPKGVYKKKIIWNGSQKSFAIFLKCIFSSEKYVESGCYFHKWAEENFLYLKGGKNVEFDSSILSTTYSKIKFEINKSNLHIYI